MKFLLIFIVSLGYSLGDIYSPKEGRIPYTYIDTHLFPVVRGNKSFDNIGELKKVYEEKIKRSKIHRNSFKILEFEEHGAQYAFCLFDYMIYEPSYKEINGWKYEAKKKKWNLIFVYTHITNSPTPEFRYNKEVKTLFVVDSLLPNKILFGYSILPTQGSISTPAVTHDEIRIANNNLTLPEKDLTEEYEKFVELLKNKPGYIKSNALQKQKFVYREKELPDRIYMYFLYPVQIDGEWMFKLDGWRECRWANEKVTYAFIFSTYMIGIDNGILSYDSEKRILQVKTNNNEVKEKIVFNLILNEKSNQVIREHIEKK